MLNLNSLFGVLVLACASWMVGQEEAKELGAKLQELYRYYKPQSMLQIEEHPVERAKFPVADVHCHWDSRVSPEALIQEMDRPQYQGVLSEGRALLEYRLPLVRNRVQGRWPRSF